MELKESYEKNKDQSLQNISNPVLLYGCETWKMNKEDGRMPDVFQQKCLRRILHENSLRGSCDKRRGAEKSRHGAIEL